MATYLLYMVFSVRSAISLDVKLGMLSPFRHPRLGWENNAAAATIAVDRAQQQGLLVEHNITVLWRDDHCSAEGGTAGTLKFRDDDVDVLIGPPCSAATTPAGLLAAYWNIPIFSQASSDPELANKNVYKTLVRLGPPFNKMGKVLVKFFQHFNWTEVVVISKRKTDNKNVFCDYSSRSIEEEFRTNSIDISDFIAIDENIADKDMDSVLDRAKRRGRIILLCTEIVVDRRRMLIRADEKGMTDGNYVFILPDHLPTTNIERPWIQNDEADTRAKTAFTSAFQVSVAEMAGPGIDAFRDHVTAKMADYPWYYNYTAEMGIRGSVYSAFLHDAVYLYLMALNDTLSRGHDHRNGTLMYEHAMGKTFRGQTGMVKVDDNGDREPDYWIWDLAPLDDLFRVAMEVSLTNTTNLQKISVLRNIIWQTKDGLAPPSTPVCGFNNERCTQELEDKTQNIIIATAVVIVSGIAMTLIGIILYRKAKFERELNQQSWRIDYSDITFTKSKMTGSISQISLASNALSNGSSSNVSDNQTFSQIGYYKGNVAAVKKLESTGIILDRMERMELKSIKEMLHDNINMFIGMCVDDRCPCILTAYCSKGSLEDIIENEDIKLEWMFKVSLIKDLTNAMLFLHSSLIRYHGNLKSSNCLVDNRWVLKVTDYGLGRIRSQQRSSLDTDHRFLTGMFWTSPELLDIQPYFRRGSPKADVYAYGIVLYEILYRKAPYDTTIYSPIEIITNVKMRQNPPFRPTSLSDYDTNMDWKLNEKASSRLKELVHKCWADCCESRPTFFVIKRVVAWLYGGKKLNIMDNMVKMLEKYAVNLEGIVEQRTQQLTEEKKKTDSLLYRMLPKTVAESLKVGKWIEPEVFESVTIFFSDIVGFTHLSSTSSPIEIVDFLNDLYTTFDNTIEMHDVYKVETIGDAYMVVSGLPVRNKNRHCIEIANMSLDLLKCADCFKIRHKPGTNLQLRIGLHTGPCAAGVVGQTMPRYCLFGDTVNMASRMESTGEAMKIHMSESARDKLMMTNLFSIQYRGSTDIKGKGAQQTFWLLGHSSSTNLVKGTDNEFDGTTLPYFGNL